MQCCRTRRNCTPCVCKSQSSPTDDCQKCPTKTFCSTTTRPTRPGYREMSSHLTVTTGGREKEGVAIGALISAGTAAFVLLVVLVLCIVLYRRLHRTDASNEANDSSRDCGTHVENPGYGKIKAQPSVPYDSDSGSDLDDSPAVPQPQPAVHHASHPRYQYQLRSGDSSSKQESSIGHVDAAWNTTDDADGEKPSAFWQPGKTLSELFAQFERKQFRRLVRAQLKLDDRVIGDGEFGKVQTGTLKTVDKTVTVAVKLAKSNCSTDDKIRFMREAAIMGQFKHKNILYLHGAVLQGDPMMMVMEMMSSGDLKTYLGLLQEKVDENTERACVKMCRDIACGMEYLSKKSFVHRDLAARNVLMDSNKTCKIGDFGLARDLISNNYYFSEGERFPLRWTAPEAVRRGKYSTASDVWSYGIVLYEIWSLGKRPYGTEWSNDYVVQRINSGYRMPPPPGCPRPIYQLMIDCWHPDHHGRPTFKNIVESLERGVMFGLVYKDRRGAHAWQDALGDPLDGAERKYADLQAVYLTGRLGEQ